MGPVELAIRARFVPPTPLYTFGRGAPFVLSRIDANGITLLLGAHQAHTPLRWDCLESLVPYLERQGGWVPAGGTYDTQGEAGTLDEPLKGCIKRSVSRWVARVLADAGVVDVDEGPPLRVRLRRSHRSSKQAR